MRYTSERIFENWSQRRKQKLDGGLALIGHSSDVISMLIVLMLVDDSLWGEVAKEVGRRAMQVGKLQSIPG